jgi:small subunit ribosomal protein S4
MKYNGPKARKCRRQGMNLYAADKYDRILARKPYGPGKSPKSRTGKESEYCKQLKEKQRVRDIYGLSERQFRRLYTESLKAKGKTGDMMKQLLERRLDNVLYRAGFARTRLQARQFAGHGIFTVDSVRVTSPSYRVSIGEKITVRAQCKDSPVFAEIAAAHEKYLAPKWLRADTAKLEAEVITLPMPEDAEQAADLQQVVELYSRN